MLKGDNPLASRIGPFGITAVSRIRTVLGTIFPIIGLTIVSLFGIIALLDTPKKDDIKNAESDLESARELRDLSFQNEMTLYDLEHIGGRLRPGEIEKASEDFQRARADADTAKKRLDKIRAGRRPIWAGAIFVGISVIFLRLIYKAASIVMIIVGLAVAAYFLFLFNTAVNGVHNLGLFQDRLLGCITGLAVFVAGVLVGLLRRRST